MLTVMSRQEAIRYCHIPHSNKSVIISISDPYEQYTSEPFTSNSNGVCSILRLSFCDADETGRDVYNREVGETDLISDNDAKNIAEFAARHADKDIIVHCDAGISRSAGVGAAIMKWAAGNDDRIFDSGRYMPNMRCYRKTLEALMIISQEKGR